MGGLGMGSGALTFDLTSLLKEGAQKILVGTPASAILLLLKMRGGCTLDVVSTTTHNS